MAERSLLQRMGIQPTILPSFRHQRSAIQISSLAKFYFSKYRNDKSKEKEAENGPSFKKKSFREKKSSLN